MNVAYIYIRWKVKNRGEEVVRSCFVCFTLILEKWFPFGRERAYNKTQGDNLSRDPKILGCSVPSVVRALLRGLRCLLRAYLPFVLLS